MIHAVYASSTTPRRFLEGQEIREGLVIENTDTHTLYILLGSGTPSSTNYSFALGRYSRTTLGAIEAPIQGVWSGNGSGSAMITSIQPTATVNPQPRRNPRSNRR